MSTILITSSTFASTAPEPDSDTFARATPFEFGLTGGSITQTAITTTDVTAASVASHLGNWVEALDGDVLGERVQVRATAVGPPAVLTTDSWSSASPTATRFRLWTPPEPLVAATGSGNVGGTTVAATGRDEADDYFNDPDRLYLVCVESGGAGTIARGEARLISDFTSGTVTVGTAFSAQSVIGDLFVMRQPIHMVGELELPSLAATYHDRKFMKTGHSRDPGVAGLREGSALTLRGEVKGSASAASGATGASMPAEVGDFLRSILDHSRGSGISAPAYSGDGASTVAAASTTTVVNVAAGHGVRFAVGNVILVNGEATGITAINTDDALTVSPALSTSPPTGALVLGTLTFRPYAEPVSSNFRGHTFEAYPGDTSRVVVYGWKFNVMVEGLAQNEIPRYVFGGPFDTYCINDVTRLYDPTFDTQAPRPTRGATVKLRGATNSDILGITFDAGLTFTPKGNLGGIDGKDGIAFTGRDTKGSIRMWTRDFGEAHRFHRNGESELLIQIGSAGGAAWALWIPALQYSAATIAPENGGYTYDLPFNVLRSNIASVGDFGLAHG